VEEDLLEHSPAAHVRRPRLDYESHATGLDRNELGALLVAAGLGALGEHALISLLALNGLRVSEATGASIENLGVERGHRTLVITRKGGKVVTIPLAPRTARAIDLAVGERADGPIFCGPDGQRLDRHGAARVVRRVARRAGITKPVGPHADPRTTLRYDRARGSRDRHATYIVAAYLAGAARVSSDCPKPTPPGPIQRPGGARAAGAPGTSPIVIGTAITNRRSARPRCSGRRLFGHARIGGSARLPEGGQSADGAAGRRCLDGGGVSGLPAPGGRG